MMLLIIGILDVIAVVLWIAILHAEGKDKEYRRANGLPPKRYHDVTDYDDLELHYLIIEDALRNRK